MYCRNVSHTINITTTTMPFRNNLILYLSSKIQYASAAPNIMKRTNRKAFSPEVHGSIASGETIRTENPHSVNAVMTHGFFIHLQSLLEILWIMKQTEIITTVVSATAREKIRSAGKMNISVWVLKIFFIAFIKVLL